MFSVREALVSFFVCSGFRIFRKFGEWLIDEVSNSWIGENNLDSVLNFSFSCLLINQRSFGEFFFFF